MKGVRNAARAQDDRLVSDPPTHQPTDPPQNRPAISRDAPPIPEKQAWRALTALSIGLFITLLDQSLVAVSLPSIRAEFDASINPGRVGLRRLPARPHQSRC